MKILFPVLFCCLIMLTGCASSERMSRISGGVFDEYSAPKSHRIRSEKFQKGSAAIGKPRDNVKGQIGDSKAIINLWPFFFKNQNYVSAFWPIFDCDPYGWAFRPVYNQEGNDCSILFPLSSWNISGKDGWVLNFVFANCYFGFVPVTYHQWFKDSSRFWYTPLLIHNDCRNPSPSWKNPFVSKSFTEFCLAYRGNKKSMKAVEKCLYSCRYSWDLEQEFRKRKNVIRYYYHKMGEPMPDNAAQFKKSSDRLFQKYYREETESYGGFFPLFHLSRKKDLTKFNILGLLMDTVKSPDYSRISVIGSVIGQYKKQEKQKNLLRCRWGTDFGSFCLLSGFENQYFYRPAAEDKIIGNLTSRSFGRGFDVRSASTQNDLKKIHPDAVKNMPETVVDGETFRLYLDELSQNVKREVGCDKNGGCLPLFRFKAKDNGEFSWFSLPLLSFYKSGKKGKFCFLFPLLSGFKTSKEKDSYVFLAALGSLCTANRTAPENRHNLAIFSKDTKWLPENNCDKLRYEDQYYSLGLFYRGKDYFYVAKEGLKGNPDQLKKDIKKVIHKYQALQDREKKLAVREKQNKERVIKTKIDRYYQLIEEEKIRLEREKCKDDLLKIGQDAAGVLKLAKQLNFKLSADFYKDRKNIQLLGNRIIDELAELRGSEDFGNGFIFRKEIYYNQDYNWKFLGYAAGGEKTGGYEKTHILHLLYRHTRQGNKEETVCFPFIVMGKNGKDSHFSFMWRVFNLEKKGGKTSGHILFIPF